MNEISFNGRTAIITGAATGLGRSHALGLAARGCNVVVNDLGVALDGRIADSQAAEETVSTILAAGGKAMASGADVTDPAQVEQMVAAAIDAFGSVDILVNNAGFLRDKSFAKMAPDDFHKVVEVHLIGSVNCARSVWPHMTAQGYGRIVMTTSSSGMYGNFGQSNYGAAKAGVVGLMNVLAIEGAARGIKVNCLSPTAATRMTAGLLDPEAEKLLSPRLITPGLLALVAPDAPTGMILAAGAGCFAEIRISETEGVAFADDELNPEGVIAAMSRIRAAGGEQVLADAFAQTRRFARKAAERRGFALPWEA